jgi:SOS response regulatory protein OraA/RecX
VFPDDGSRAETEGERARSIAAALLAGLNAPPDAKALAKAGRKLAGLGYDSELIYRILGEYMQRGKP